MLIRTMGQLQAIVGKEKFEEAKKDVTDVLGRYAILFFQNRAELESCCYILRREL